MPRVAVVTGGNKGIGFAVVKGLCEQFDGIVYLTARSEERGRAAVEELGNLGLQPRFHQLDINDDSSVNNLAKYLNDMHGGLDVLVNNAAIAFKRDSTEPFSFQAAETIRVNYFGLLRVSKALFPMLRPHARVVQVSSSAGHLSRIPGDKLKAELSSPDLTEERLNHMMKDYVRSLSHLKVLHIDDETHFWLRLYGQYILKDCWIIFRSVEANVYLESGWSEDIYLVSKVGVCTLTRLQQKLFDKDEREDLVVNSVHPGYVDTDMTRHRGHFTPERGAQAPIFLALLPRHTDIRGKFVWHDKTPIDWVHGRLPARY